MPSCFTGACEKASASSSAAIGRSKAHPYSPSRAQATYARVTPAPARPIVISCPISSTASVMMRTPEREMSSTTTSTGVQPSARIVLGAPVARRSAVRTFIV